jgi:hypothetical protein
MKIRNQDYFCSFSVLIIVFIVYVFILAVFSISGFPTKLETGLTFPYLTDKPVGEDGYYMLSVAWNLAGGEGITYNFGKPTTGIQPLYTLVLASAAFFIQLLDLNKWFFVRFVLVLGSINLLVFAHLSGVIARRITPLPAKFENKVYYMAFVIALFNFGLFRIFTYGLESGLYLVLIQLVILYSLRLDKNQNNSSQAFVFGILTGITVLARIDFVVILGVYIIYSLFQQYGSIKWWTLFMIVFVLMISPWFFYVYQVTGSIIPSSGISQKKIIDSSSGLNRIFEISRSLLSHLVPFIYSRPSWCLSVISLIILFIVTVIILRTKENRDSFKLLFQDKMPLVGWLLGVLALGVIYLIGFHATHFYTRYISPLSIILIPTISIVIVSWFQHLSKAVQRSIPILLTVLFFLWAGITLHTGVITNTHAVSAGYIDKNFSDSVKVGAFQSGTVGFYNENVINLDGKVNHEANFYLRKGSMQQYIDREKINVIIDWRRIIENFLPEKYLMDYWEPCEIPIDNGLSICLIRK